MGKRPKVKPVEEQVKPELPPEPKLEDPKKTFDDIVDNPELFGELRRVLEERGYVVVKEPELVSAFVSLRIVPGNEARGTIRRVLTHILKEEGNDVG